MKVKKADEELRRIKDKRKEVKGKEKKERVESPSSWATNSKFSKVAIIR
jgi:hypothetical protein